jgi:hypothetical protein
MILITADDLGAHEFESGKRNSRELALTDWVRVAGLLIFVPAFFPGESIGLAALRIMRVFQANRSSTFVWRGFPRAKRIP